MSSGSGRRADGWPGDRAVTDLRLTGTPAGPGDHRRHRHDRLPTDLGTNRAPQTRRDLTQNDLGSGKMAKEFGELDGRVISRDRGVPTADGLCLWPGRCKSSAIGGPMTRVTCWRYVTVGWRGPGRIRPLPRTAPRPDICETVRRGMRDHAVFTGSC